MLVVKKRERERNKEFSRPRSHSFVQSWFIVAFILSREDHSKSHPLVSNANKTKILGPLFDTTCGHKIFFVSFGVLVVMEDFY